MFLLICFAVVIMDGIKYSNRYGYRLRRHPPLKYWMPVHYKTIKDGQNMCHVSFHTSFQALPTMGHCAVTVN